MRSLSPDETALWARVMATARPLRAATVPSARTDRKPVPAELVEAQPSSPDAAKKKGSALRLAGPGSRSGRVSTGAGRTEVRVKSASPAKAPADTLDGGWDKRLTRGIVVPDATVDLHGHTLHSAHDLLDAALARAIARGDRVVLLVTGRPPRPESERPHARGAIRAAVGDWLAASRHAAQIAAVRGAHPRHGGAGALYLILRRAREGQPDARS